MTAYYNDNDPEACAVLKELIARNIIAPGDVDSRSIKEVQADDVCAYTQCHFFAGAGTWSVAARLSGWDDDRPLWTASCPCQPFSAAGRQGGADDPRHLWPDLYRIIRSGLSSGFTIPVLVGEQVAGAPGYAWFDGVRADLEKENISARAIDIPACAIDSPHERNRLWWVAVGHMANTDGRGEPRRCIRRPSEGVGEDRLRSHHQPGGSDGGTLADAQRAERRSINDPGERDDGQEKGRVESANQSGKRGQILADAQGIHSRGEFPIGRSEQRAVDGRTDAGGDLEHAESFRRGEGWPEHELWRGGDASTDPDVLGDACSAGLEGIEIAQWSEASTPRRPDAERTDGGNRRSFWDNSELITCHDGKARRAKSSIPMLVDGMVGRIGLWRLVGNSIVPQLAAEVLSAVLEIEGMT